MFARHVAVEKRTFEEILVALPRKEEWARLVFSRLKRVTAIPGRPRVLDVGAGAGEFLVACHRMGFLGEGIEPSGDARRLAAQLSEHLGIPITLVGGSAESIPYEGNTFDVVHASSVIEHVSNVEKAFEEISRVLRPGGVVWFNAASAMCPWQSEIRGFPLFGWYPNLLKLRIMRWVKDARPHLVGCTRTPAINWFTPSKARTLLEKYRFGQIHDRWDLRLPEEGGLAYRLALRAIRSASFLKDFADIVVQGCSYAAVKQEAS